jgi:hypothetical protein
MRDSSQKKLGVMRIGDKTKGLRLNGARRYRDGFRVDTQIVHGASRRDCRGLQVCLVHPS